MERCCKNISGILKDESGRLSSLSMLFCIVCIGGYLKVGRFELHKHIDARQEIVLLLILGSITLFTVGFVVQTMLMGERSPGQLRREIKRQAKVLGEFVAASRKRMNEVEDMAAYRAGLFRPVAYDNISHLRQILMGLDRRVAEVEFLLSTRRRKFLYLAAEAMGSDLKSFENSLVQLIDSRPLPAIPADAWIPTVERLLLAVEEEGRRAQSVRAA